MKVLVTGGAGFIGVSVINHFIHDLKYKVLNVDKLTYAGNLQSLESVVQSPLYAFENVDILSEHIGFVLNEFKPDKIMHLAAESHVDRSIVGPAEFIQTNIIGTYNMLNYCKRYWDKLPKTNKSEFRFHHISTDEVYGDLDYTGNKFTEKTAYYPSSPYSASKASADHLVRAWHRTYNLPILITNCSNNYGPYQFPEKLIPLVIINAVSGKPIPIYGKGNQIRDWLYVEDHAKALGVVLKNGKSGETYNIGGENEKSNLEVVEMICGILDKLIPNHPAGIKKYSDLITFVDDRPGHDYRYAINSSKIQQDLNWKPQETFETGIIKTVKWYINNKKWWQMIQDGSYLGKRLETLNYGQS